MSVLYWIHFANSFQLKKVIIVKLSSVLLNSFTPLPEVIIFFINISADSQPFARKNLRFKGSHLSFVQPKILTLELSYTSLIFQDYIHQPCFVLLYTPSLLLFFNRWGIVWSRDDSSKQFFFPVVRAERNAIWLIWTFVGSNRLSKGRRLIT